LLSFPKSSKQSTGEPRAPQKGNKMQAYGFKETNSSKRIVRSTEYYQNIIDKYGDGVFSAVFSHDYIGKQVFKNEWCGDGTLSRNEEDQLFFTPYY